MRIGLPSIPFGRHLVLDHREIVRVGPWNEKGSAAVMFYFSVESACSMRRSQNSVFFWRLKVVQRASIVDCIVLMFYSR